MNEIGLTMKDMVRHGIKSDLGCFVEVNTQIP